jgi:hypothetical protein
VLCKPDKRLVVAFSTCLVPELSPIVQAAIFFVKDKSLFIT